MKYVQKCPRNNLRSGDFFFDRRLPQKMTYESRKYQISGEIGINSKLKHRKAHNSILSWRFGDPYRRLGDWCHVRASWQVHV